jgi:Na+/glutamate symporter
VDKRFMAELALCLTFCFTSAGYAQEVDWSIPLGDYQTPMFLQLSDQAYLLGVASAKKEERGSEELPLSGGMIAKEISAGGGLGTALGMAGGVIGFKIADAVWPPEGEHGAWMTKEEFICGSVGLVGGFIFGSAIGVYLIGTGDNVTGSFSRALLGSTIGICIPAPLVGPAIGAAIAFNPTRRHKSSANSDKQMSSTTPSIRLDLLRVRF